jgi:hypothetical protein
LCGLSAVGYEGLANFAAEDSLVTKLFGVIEEIGEMLAANMIFQVALPVARHEGPAWNSVSVTPILLKLIPRVRVVRWLT